MATIYQMPKVSRRARPQLPAPLKRKNDVDSNNNISSIDDNNNSSSNNNNLSNTNSISINSSNNNFSSNSISSNSSSSNNNFSSNSISSSSNSNNNFSSSNNNNNCVIADSEPGFRRPRGSAVLRRSRYETFVNNNGSCNNSTTDDPSQLRRPIRDIVPQRGPYESSANSNNNNNTNYNNGIHTDTGFSRVSRASQLHRSQYQTMINNNMITDNRPVVNRASRTRSADTRVGNIAARSFGSFLRKLRLENQIPSPGDSESDGSSMPNSPKLTTRRSRSSSRHTLEGRESRARIKLAFLGGYDENRNAVSEADRTRFQMAYNQDKSHYTPSTVDNTSWDSYSSSMSGRKLTQSQNSDLNNNRMSVNLNNLNMPESSIHRKLDNNHVKVWNGITEQCVIAPTVDYSETVLPDDIDVIEAELSSMRDDSGDSEKLCPFDNEVVGTMKDNSEGFKNKLWLSPLDETIIDKRGMCSASKERMSSLHNEVIMNTGGHSKNLSPLIDETIINKRDNCADRLSPMNDNIIMKEDKSGLHFVTKSSTDLQNEKARKWQYSNTRKFPSGAYVVLTRDPISPFTVMEDIQSIESEMQGGHYTAKGRRRMFRNCKMFTQEDAGHVPEHLLWYSADDLLKLGTNPVCHVAPESWNYKMKILPTVCLEVTQQFDTLHYMEERSYVEHQSGYVVESSTTHINRSTQGRPSCDEKTRMRSQSVARTRWPPSEAQLAASNKSMYASHEETSRPSQSGPGPSRWAPSDAQLSSFNKRHSGPDITNVDSQSGYNTQWVPSKTRSASCDRSRPFESNKIDLDSKSDVSVRQGSISSIRTGNFSRPSNLPPEPREKPRWAPSRRFSETIEKCPW